MRALLSAAFRDYKRPIRSLYGAPRRCVCALSHIRLLTRLKLGLLLIELHSLQNDAGGNYHGARTNAKIKAVSDEIEVLRLRLTA